MNKDFHFKTSYDFDDLVSIMSILRGDGGCPWDREQDHKTIRNNFIEEVYEAVEAIDTENRDLLQEELGDVLLQIVFHARIEEEAGGFDIHAVCDGICKKLIHRHPHIFSNVEVADSDEVLTNWNAIKRLEKNQTTVKKEMADVARSLPALMRTQKVIKRAGNAGVLACDSAVALSDLKAAVAAMSDAPSKKEIGRLLFDVCRVCQNAGVEGEEALYEACDAFIEADGRL